MLFVVFWQPFALFRGMGVPLATVPLIHAVMFTGYGTAKRFLASKQPSDTPWFNNGTTPAPPHHPHSHPGVLTVADHGVIAVDEEIDDSELELWQLGVAGGFSGFVNSAIVGPVELVKIQLQVQAADKKNAMTNIGGVLSRHYHGPWDFAKTAASAHGWRALLQGLFPTVVVETLACAGQFVAYEVRVCVWRCVVDVSACFDWLLCCVVQGLLRAMIRARDASPSVDNSSINEPSVAQQLFAGGCSGIVANGIIYPLDVVKTRIQSFPIGQPLPPYGQSHRLIPDGGMIGVWKHVGKVDGIGGYWRGFWPCVIPAFPANAVGFVVYETIIKYWPKT